MIPISDIITRSISGYIFMIPILVFFFIYLHKTGRKQSILHIVSTFIFCYYLFGVLTVTGIGYTNSIHFRPNISWTPFIGMITGPVDTALNIILFVPFGFFLPQLFKKFNNIKATALAGFLLSLSVELVQLFNWGSSDINDLMTNTAGACIGYLIYCLLAKVLPSKLKKQLQAKHINSIVLVGLYIICTFVIMVTGQRWVVHGLLNIP